MTADVDVLVVGASVAGARCAQALRTNGFDGSILLVGDDIELPHDRPPLSKQFLAGEWDAPKLCLLTAERAAELGIALRLGVAAAALDLAHRQVTLADRTLVRFASLVIATGASARPSPWGTPPGVHTLRSLADSRRLREQLHTGARVVVIGGGWIGSEVAATAVGIGCQVVVLDGARNPYARSLGPELGELLSGVHHWHDVPTHYGAGVENVCAAADGLVVELADGGSLAADVVVVGIGAAPNTQWLTGSGLSVEDGVACDDFGRAIGADGRPVPGVWAVGDVARWGRHRHEHWSSAIEQARAVAHNLTHPLQLTASADDGYVWSDQYGWRVQLVGETGPHLESVLVEHGHNDAGAPRVAALYRDADGRLVGTATVNWPKAFLAGRHAIGQLTAAEHEASLRALSVPSSSVPV
jgi:NADPH-dependent 2,4-dienoyl-CoA reductase/sulfur reductase-like enzyme